MNATSGLWQGLGYAAIILSLALGIEFCNRPDKSQTAGQWFGCCPQPIEKLPAERE